VSGYAKAVVELYQLVVCRKRLV